MMIHNELLNKLESERDDIRKEVKELMLREDYDTNEMLYKRVSALTGLEMYLTYRIEVLLDEISKVYNEDYLV